MKWPSSSAPVLRKRARRSSDMKISILTGSIVGGFRTGTAVVSDSDDFDFDARSFGQTGDLHGRTRRRLLFKIRAVNFVHGLEIGEIHEEDCGLDDVVEGQAFGFQNRSDVFHDAPGLHIDAAGNDLAGFGVERDLSGAINGRSNADGLRIGADGGGRIGSGNDFLHAPDSSCKFISHNGHDGPKGKDFKNRCDLCGRGARSAGLQNKSDGSEIRPYLELIVREIRRY